MGKREQFKYLGSIFVREGACKEDVKTRCLTSQVFYQLFIKAVFTPTLIYQSENWTLTSKERQMLTTTEVMLSQKSYRKEQNGQDQKRRN